MCRARHGECRVVLYRLHHGHVLREDFLDAQRLEAVFHIPGRSQRTVFQTGQTMGPSRQHAEIAFESRGVRGVDFRQRFTNRPLRLRLLFGGDLLQGGLQLLHSGRGRWLFLLASAE